MYFLLQITNNTQPNKKNLKKFVWGFLTDYIYLGPADFRSATGFSELALVFEIFEIFIFLKKLKKSAISANSCLK